MSMTRKDFLLLEHVLHEALRSAPLSERAGVERAIHQFAEILHITNWRFNKERFIDGCYEGVPDATQLFPELKPHTKTHNAE